MKTYEVQYKVDGVRTSKIVSASSDTQARRLIKVEIQEMTWYDKSRKVEIFTPHEIKYVYRDI